MFFYKLVNFAKSVVFKAFVWYNTRGKREVSEVAKIGNRQRKTLVCTVCNEENYRTNKNVKNTTERLELSKYCSRCQKHTVHKEKK